MGFQDVVGRRVSCRYEKLTGDERKEARPRNRRHWVKKMNGRLKGLRLCRLRKLTIRALPVIILPSKIARIYADIVERMKTDDLCPNIIFFTQWGLPVLSHSSLKCRKNVIY